MVLAKGRSVGVWRTWLSTLVLFLSACGTGDTMDPGEEDAEEGSYVYKPPVDQPAPQPTLYEKCLSDRPFAELCLEDPRSYSCVSICNHAEENCGNPDLCTVSFYDTCMAAPNIPNTPQECEEFICFMSYSEPPPTCEGLGPGGGGGVPDGEYGVVVSASDYKDFVIQTKWGNKLFEAWTYCFNVWVGDEVVFLDSTGVCVSNTFVVPRNGDECKVWCK